jgi:hypothetical protein
MSKPNSYCIKSVILLHHVIGQSFLSVVIIVPSLENNFIFQYYCRRTCTLCQANCKNYGAVESPVCSHLIQD